MSGRAPRAGSRRRAAAGGFTLVELLVVISIIATLAALLIPGVTLVKSKANDLKCSNNLRQVATGIIAWQGSHDDECPPSLLAMFDASSGLQLKGLETKLLICPIPGIVLNTNLKISLFLSDPNLKCS